MASAWGERGDAVHAVAEDAVLTMSFSRLDRLVHGLTRVERSVGRNSAVRSRHAADAYVECVRRAGQLLQNLPATRGP